MGLRARLPPALHRVERAVPASVRRLLKRVAPGFVNSTHNLIVSAAPGEAAEATIADGPLRGRRFTCRVRYEADYLFGTHEPAVTNWLSHHVKPSSIVFDIGAHAGYTALIAAQLVGAEGLVVAFEPNPQNLKLIDRNLAANGDLARRIRVEARAVSDSCGTELFGGEESTGRLQSGGSPVTTTSIDAYVRETGRTPFLIKLDIEGGETRAFDGMEATLRRSRPVIIVEIHDGAAHTRFSRLVAEHGYQVSAEGAGRAGSGLASWHHERQLYLAH